MKLMTTGLLLTALALPAPCESASRQDPVPRWTTDLRTAGYRGDDFSPPGPYQADRQIAFGTYAELVVANDANTSFEHPGPVTGFVLNTGSGEVVNKATWRARGFPYVFATHLGAYVVNTESGASLYSEGLRTVKTAVPYSVDLASPDGTSFAAWKGVPGPHGVTFFLRPETLRPSGVEYIDEDIDSICGDRAASTSIVNFEDSVDVLAPADVLYTYLTRCSELRPAFVSTNILAVVGCGHVDVIETLRGLRFSHKTGACETRFVGASRDGSRFVIAETFYGRGDEPRLRFERFTVIDVNAHTPILVVETKELRGRRRAVSGAALAPDGSLLAINSLGAVQLFSVTRQDTENGLP